MILNHTREAEASLKFTDLKSVHAATAQQAVFL